MSSAADVKIVFTRRKRAVAPKPSEPPASATPTTRPTVPISTARVDGLPAITAPEPATTTATDSPTEASAEPTAHAIVASAVARPLDAPPADPEPLHAAALDALDALDANDSGPPSGGVGEPVHASAASAAIARVLATQAAEISTAIFEHAVTDVSATDVSYIPQEPIAVHASIPIDVGYSAAPPVVTDIDHVAPVHVESVRPAPVATARDPYGEIDVPIHLDSMAPPPVMADPTAPQPLVATGAPAEVTEPAPPPIAMWEHESLEDEDDLPEIDLPSRRMRLLSLTPPAVPVPRLLSLSPPPRPSVEIAPPVASATTKQARTLIDLTPPNMPPAAALRRDAPKAPEPAVVPPPAPAPKAGAKAFELPNPWASETKTSARAAESESEPKRRTLLSWKARSVRAVILTALAILTGVGVRGAANHAKASNAPVVAPQSTAPAAPPAAKPAPVEATIEIRTAPGTNVLVDGKPRGEGPIVAIKLAPGYHQIRAGGDKTKLVEVHAGDALTVDLTQ